MKERVAKYSRRWIVPALGKFNKRKINKSNKFDYLFEWLNSQRITRRINKDPDLE